MTTTGRRSLCDCGTTRIVSAGTGCLECAHCDRGCEERGCDTCAKFTAAVSRRITQ